MNSEDKLLALDEILLNVTARAKELALDESFLSVDDVSFHEVISNDQINHSLLEISDFATPFTRKYFHISEFTDIDDKEFISYAYRTILKREVDEQGFSGSLGYLQSGGNRYFVLISLMLSDEGKKQHVRLQGLPFIRRIYRLFSFLGRPGEKLDLALQRFSKSDRNKKIKQQYLAVADFHEFEKKLHECMELLKNADDRMVKRLSIESGKLWQATRSMIEELPRVHQDLRYQQKNVQLLLDQLKRGDEKSIQKIQKSINTKQLDAYYVAFEDACRGSKKIIKKSLEIYLPYLGNISQRKINNIVDLGCGRGEWLELLEENGWSGVGIDMNEIMIQECSDLGLKVYKLDALTYLRSLADNSQAHISGFHILEHLPFAVLFDIFLESMRVLVPGGKIIFETPNPENLLVGAHTFYHDFTHKNPITPTSLEFLAQYHGFSHCQILRLHPYPDDAKVIGDDPVTARVNGHFCGPQDFALIAAKPLDKK